MANEFKEKGNEALKEGKIDEAIDFYTKVTCPEKTCTFYRILIQY